MIRFVLTLIIVALAGFAAAPAQAQLDLVPEIRAGLLATDLGSDDALFSPERIGNANVELLFSPFGPSLTPLEFRPHVGATVNFADEPSTGYAGLSATFRLPMVPVFAEASLGAAIHNGALRGDEPDAHFGCTVLGRGSVSVGVDVLPFTSVMLTAEHLTDGGLCGDSDGQTNVGVRLGLRF